MTPKRRAVAAEVKLDPKNPIPIEVGGHSFSPTVGGSLYLPFLSPGNDFPNLLLEAAALSPTHQACISTKTRYSIGQGFAATETARAAADPLFQAFLGSCNARSASLHSQGRRFFGSLFKFGNVPVEIVVGDIQGLRFVYVYVKSFLDCRLSIPNGRAVESDAMIVSRTFRRRGAAYSDENARRIPLYKRGKGVAGDCWMQDKNVRRTALWIRNEMEGYEEYGFPSSGASLIWQLLEYNDGRYNMDDLENNTVIGGAIVLSGNLDQSEANRLARQIINQHTGAGKRGRVAVFASEAGINDSKFLPFDTKKDGSYATLSERCERKIILANEWDAVLAGLQSSTTLGKGSGYLQEIYHQKFQTVIRPAQQVCLDEFIAPIVEIADDWLGTRWSEYGIDIQPAQVINKSSELTSTVKGAELFLKIVSLVAAGTWSREAAIAFIVSRFGSTKQEAEEQLGQIHVSNQQPGTPAPNIGAGGNP